MDRNWKQVLRDEIGEQFLLPYWGGSKVAESPTGLIRMCGDVPDDIKENAIKNMKRIPKEKLTTIKINARDQAFILIQVNEPESVLSWYFTVYSGDIDFSISFNGDLICPVFRISTEFVPEYGKIVCTKKGLYTLHMDNRHSIFRAETIFYNVQIANRDGHAVINK